MPVPKSPATGAVAEHHAEPVAPSSPTIAQRLSRRAAGHPHEGDNRVLSQLDFEGINLADDSVIALEEATLPLRAAPRRSRACTQRSGGATSPGSSGPRARIQPCVAFDLREQC